MEKITITADEFIEKTGNMLVKLASKEGCPEGFMSAGLILTACIAGEIFGEIPEQEYEAIYHIKNGEYIYMVGKGGTIEVGCYGLDIYRGSKIFRKQFATEKECYIAILDHIQSHNK